MSPRFTEKMYSSQAKKDGKKEGRKVGTEEGSKMVHKCCDGETEMLRRYTASLHSTTQHYDTVIALIDSGFVAPQITEVGPIPPNSWGNPGKMFRSSSIDANALIASCKL